MPSHRWVGAGGGGGGIGITAGRQQVSRPIGCIKCGFSTFAERRRLPFLYQFKAPDYLQAVDHGASFPALPLPLVHLSEQVQERLLGVGNVAIGRPAEELELAHHQLALLELNMARNTKIQERTIRPSDVSFAFRVLPSPRCNSISPAVAAVTPVLQRSRLRSFCEIYEVQAGAAACAREVPACS